MKKYFFFFLLIIIYFISCGTSADEKATLRKLFTDSLNHTQMLINKYDSLIREAKMQVEVENSKMASIKGFQFLRTESEKAEQIKNQRKYIMELEKSISDAENYVQVLNYHLPAIQQELNKYY